MVFNNITLCVSYIYIYIYIANIFNVSKIRKNNFILFFIILFSIEASLRFILKKNLSFLEINQGVGGFYLSQYRFGIIDEENRSNTTSLLENPEFSIIRKYNNIGLRSETNILISKDTIENRIFCMGDSWTEGNGVIVDSTYPSLLQNFYLNTNVKIYNIGFEGTDVVDMYKKIHQLSCYRPDIVIFSTNYTDLGSMVTRGGLERYDSEFVEHGKAGPWWEIIYGSSYIVRYFIKGIGYNNLLIKSNENTYAVDKLVKAIIKMHKYCEDESIRFILVINPDKEEVSDKNLNPQMNSVIKKLKEQDKNIELINLLPLYIYNGVNKSNISNYYWQYDMHHNVKGYALFAKCVYENININNQ